MSARRLLSLAAYSATGVPVALPDALARVVAGVVLRERLGDPARLTLEGLDGVLLSEYAVTSRRAIVRADFADVPDTSAEVTFWRVSGTETAYGEGQRWSATCEPLWLALDENVVSETLASTGFVDVGVTLGGRLDDVLARLLSSAYNCPDGLVTFALGSVEASLAAKPVFVTLTNASTLEGIRQVLEKAGGEAEFVAGPGSGPALAHYLLLVKERIGSPGYALRPVAGTGSVVNRIGLTRRGDCSAYFSHLAAVAAGDSPVTLSTATWGVTAASEADGATTLTLAGDPVWEDGALVGLAVRAPLGGALMDPSALFPIVASAAPATLVVTGDAQSLTAAQVREADGTDLVALPAALATQGRRVRRQAFNVSPWANALADAGASADFSSFVGGLPRGWQKVGAPTVAAVTSEGHVRYGTSSVQVTAAKDEGLVSLPILRQDARTVSAWVGTYVVDGLGGRVRLEIVDGDEGTVHPVGQKADATSETLQGLSVGGAPVVGTSFRVRVVADSPTATFILDAATATRSAEAQAYAEAMGPTALWKEAAKIVFEEGGEARPDAFDGRLYDLSALLPLYEEIRIGDSVEVSEDGEMGFTLATRVVEIEERFGTVGEQSVEKRIRLSTKRADLRRLVETGPSPDPVPVVVPVRRKAPSAQYAVGFRHTVPGEIVVLSWLGNDDVASVAWTLTAGSSTTSGLVAAQAGQIDLNAAAPLTPGTTIEVTATAFSDATGTGEKEAAPYRLVTDVPNLDDPASFVPGAATLTVQGTAGEVEVIGAQTKALATSPTFTLGLDDNVRAAQTLGVLGGPYLKRITADQIGVHAYRTDGTTPYGYVVAKGFIAYEGGTFTRVEGEVVTFSDNLVRLNSDATGPAAWGGLFIHRGGSEVVGSPRGKGIVWNESAGRWGRADVSYGPDGAEAIEMGTFEPFPVATGVEQAALNAELWGGLRRAEYVNQAVRTGDAPTFAGLVVAGPSSWGGFATVASGMGTSAFASGFSGSGWRLGMGASGADGEMNSLTLRSTLSVYEILARRVDAVGGNLLVAPRLRVASVTGSGPYVLVDEYASAIGGAALSDVEVGSYLIAQQATAAGLSQSVVLVAAKAGAEVTVSLTSGAAPWRGAVYVAFDHASDAGRRGRVYLTSREGGAPFVSVSVGSGSGVWGTGTEYARFGNLAGITALGQPLSGFGLYAGRAHLTSGAQGIAVVPGQGVTFTGLGGTAVANINADAGGLTISAARVRVGSATTFEGGYDVGMLARAFDQYRQANAIVMRDVMSRIGEGFNRLDLVEAWKDLPTGAFAGLDVRTSATEASVTALAGYVTDNSAALSALGLRATALEAEAAINTSFRTDTTTALGGLSSRVTATEAAVSVFAGLSWTDPQGVTHTGSAAVAALVDKFGSHVVLKALADGRAAGLTITVPTDPLLPATVQIDADAVIIPGTLTAGGWKAAPEELRYPATGTDYTRLEASSSFRGLGVKQDGQDVLKVGDFATGTVPAAVDITSLVVNPNLTSGTGWTAGAAAGSQGAWSYSGSGAKHSAPDISPDPTYVQAWLEQTVDVGTARAGQTVRLSVAVGGSYPVYEAATVRLIDATSGGAGDVLGSRTLLSGQYPATVTVDARVPASGLVRIRLSVSNTSATGARQATFTSVALSHYLPAMQVGRDGILAWYGPDDYISINAAARALSMPTLRASKSLSIGPSWTVEEGVGGELVFKKNGTPKAQITNGGTFQTL